MGRNAVFIDRLAPDFLCIYVRAVPVGFAVGYVEQGSPPSGGLSCSTL